MISNETQFPVYRRTADGRHYYLIVAADQFMEIQLIGSKAVMHRVQAALYPERLRVQDMIDANDGHFVASGPGEWAEVSMRFGLVEEEG